MNFGRADLLVRFAYRVVFMVHFSLSPVGAPSAKNEEPALGDPARVQIDSKRFSSVTIPYCRQMARNDNGDAYADGASCNPPVVGEPGRTDPEFPVDPFHAAIAERFEPRAA